MMTEVAGEVADGVIAHAFTTEKYLRETTLPALERGFAKAGKSRDDFEISYPAFVVTGQTEEELRDAETATCKQIAFTAPPRPIDRYWRVLVLATCRTSLTECRSRDDGMKWVNLLPPTY